MNLNLPKVAVPDRISLVQPIKANERTTVANLEGPGCIRHIWATAGREGNGRQDYHSHLFRRRTYSLH